MDARTEAKLAAHEGSGCPDCVLREAQRLIRDQPGHDWAALIAEEYAAAGYPEADRLAASIAAAASTTSR